MDVDCNEKEIEASALLGEGNDRALGQHPHGCPWLTQTSPFAHLSPGKARASSTAGWKCPRAVAERTRALCDDIQPDKLFREWLNILF